MLIDVSTLTFVGTPVLIQFLAYLGDVIVKAPSRFHGHHWVAVAMGLIVVTLAEAYVPLLVQLMFFLFVVWVAFCVLVMILRKKAHKPRWNVTRELMESMCNLSGIFLLGVTIYLIIS